MMAAVRRRPGAASLDALRPQHPLAPSRSRPDAGRGKRFTTAAYRQPTVRSRSVGAASRAREVWPSRDHGAASGDARRARQAAPWSSPGEVPDVVVVPGARGHHGQVVGADVDCCDHISARDVIARQRNLGQPIVAVSQMHTDPLNSVHVAARLDRSPRNPRACSRSLPALSLRTKRPRNHDRLAGRADLRASCRHRDPEARAQGDLHEALRVRALAAALSRLGGPSPTISGRTECR